MNPSRILFCAMAIVALASPLTSHAFKGSISFTREEIVAHEAKVDQILSYAANCLERDISHHRSFFAKHGISPFYGDRSSFAKLTPAGKRQVIRSYGANPSLLSQMTTTSCVGLVLKCLGGGFKAAGEDQAATWQRLRAFTMANAVDGSALQHGLQKLGWKILYWNPDTRMNKKWDAAERAKNPSNKDRFWGYHEANWWNARNKGRYLYNTVDDARTLVDFGPFVPAFLKKIPFFLGIAHQGYHVFPGTYGQVVESHSTRKINDPRTLESEPFNPLNGEAPTGGMYKTGLIAVPAKFLR